MKQFVKNSLNEVISSNLSNFLYEYPISEDTCIRLNGLYNGETISLVAYKVTKNEAVGEIVDIDNLAMDQYTDIWINDIADKVSQIFEGEAA